MEPPPTLKNIAENNVTNIFNKPHEHVHTETKLETLACFKLSLSA